MVEIDSEVYSERAKEEFSKRLKVLNGNLEKPIAEGNLTFGPKYHLTTSSGSQLDFQVLSTPLPSPESAPLMDSKKLTIFATEDQRLVGFRTANLLDYSQYDYADEERPSERGFEIKASGESATLERAKGIGSAMELVYLFLLQQEAYKRGVPVVHRVDPSNLRVVGVMEAVAQTDKELLLFQEKLKESDRWKNIYGSSGSLGFKDYERKFMPQDESTTTVPQDAHDVWLSRMVHDVDGRAVEAVSIVGVDTQDDPSGFQQEQLLYFNSAIAPILKASA